jgi:hypothetical protein
MQFRVLKTPCCASRMWQRGSSVPTLPPNVPTLILAGRDSACDQLRHLTDKKWDGIEQQEKANRNICFICRLIFVGKSASEPLPPPRLGALQMMPYESMKPEDWPYLPFAITNQVLLSMTLGYAGAGVPERAGNYLSYCVSNGVFRAKPFPVPTPTTASNALNQIILSSAWKGLKWNDSGLGWSRERHKGNVVETG